MCVLHEDSFSRVLNHIIETHISLRVICVCVCLFFNSSENRSEYLSMVVFSDLMHLSNNAVSGCVEGEHNEQAGNDLFDHLNLCKFHYYSWIESVCIGIT